MKPKIRYLDPFSAPDLFGPTTVSGVNSTWRPIAQPTVSKSLLEQRYPAMARAITLLWGYPEMNIYFNKLWLADDKSEPIDTEVMAELMLLARIHQHLVPQQTKNTMATMYGSTYEPLRRSDPWSDNNNRR